MAVNPTPFSSINLTNHKDDKLTQVQNISTTTSNSIDVVVDSFDNAITLSSTGDLNSINQYGVTTFKTNVFASPIKMVINGSDDIYVINSSACTKVSKTNVKTVLTTALSGASNITINEIDEVFITQTNSTFIVKILTNDTVLLNYAGVITGQTSVEIGGVSGYLGTSNGDFYSVVNNSSYKIQRTGLGNISNMQIKSTTENVFIVSGNTIQKLLYPDFSLGEKYTFASAVKRIKSTPNSDLYALTDNELHLFNNNGASNKVADTVAGSIGMAIDSTGRFVIVGSGSTIQKILPASEHRSITTDMNGKLILSNTIEGNELLVNKRDHLNLTLSEYNEMNTTKKAFPSVIGVNKVLTNLANGLLNTGIVDFTTETVRLTAVTTNTLGCLDLQAGFFLPELKTIPYTFAGAVRTFKNIPNFPLSALTANGMSGNGFTIAGIGFAFVGLDKTGTFRFFNTKAEIDVNPSVLGIGYIGVSRSTGGTITFIDMVSRNTYNFPEFANISDYQRTRDGLTTTVSLSVSATTLSFSLSTGIINGMGINWTGSGTTLPHTKSILPATGATNFFLIDKTQLNSVSLPAQVNAITNTLYFDIANNGLLTMPNNTAAVFRVMMTLNGVIFVQYGEYANSTALPASLAQAQVQAEITKFTDIVPTSTFITLGFFAFIKNATNLDGTTQGIFIPKNAGGGGTSSVSAPLPATSVSLGTVKLAGDIGGGAADANAPVVNGIMGSPVAGITGPVWMTAGVPRVATTNEVVSKTALDAKVANALTPAFIDIAPSQVAVNTALATKLNSSGGTVTGAITFNTDIIVNQHTVGRGGGNKQQNVVVGNSALLSNVTGINTVAVGYQALTNSTGTDNTAVGFRSMYTNLTGSNSCAFGILAVAGTNQGDRNNGFGNSTMNSVTGNDNNAFGYQALNILSIGDNNVAFGNNAGKYISGGVTGMISGNTSLFIGNETRALGQNQSNQIVIGYSATGIGSNSVVLGNDAITKTALKGNVLVGTTTDDTVSKLQVSGSSKFVGAFDNALAPLIVQNTTPYGGAFSENSQLWLNSAGGILAQLKNNGAFTLNGNGEWFGTYFLSNGGSLSQPSFGNGASSGLYFPAGFPSIVVSAAERARFTTTALLLNTTTDNGVDRLQVNGSALVDTIKIGNQGGGYYGVNTSTPFAFFSGNSGQKILTSGILASDQFTDVSQVPTNGIYSKGITITNGLKYILGINLSTTDLNTVTDAGFYYGVNGLNSPIVGDYYLTVERWVTNLWVHQTLTSFGSNNVANKMYSRVKQNGVWTGWNEVLTNDITGNTSTAILNQTAIVQPAAFNVSGDSKINGLTIGRGGFTSTANTANTVLGFEAGLSLSGADYNTLIGYQAGRLVSTGGENVFVGRLAGANNTVGNQSTYVGTSAGYNTTTGTRNHFIGWGAGYNNIIGQDNTIVGGSAGFSATGASGNCYFGYQSGFNNINSGNNSFFGTGSGGSNGGTGIGAENSGFGYLALGSLTGNTTAYNTAIGSRAGYIRIGGFALRDALSSTFIGTLAKASGEGQTNQTVIGYDANGIGSNSVVLGNDSVTKTALKGNVLVGTTTDTAAYKLQVVGADALINGLVVGKGAGQLIQNTVVGNTSLVSNVSGLYNTAIGANVLSNLLTGNQSTGIGYNALNSSNGAMNTAVGYESLGSIISTLSNNTAIGSQSGKYLNNKSTLLTTPSNGVYIGFRTSALVSSAINETVIGYDASGLGTNSTVIGNTSTTQARIYGALTADSFTNASGLTAVSTLADVTITATSFTINANNTRYIVNTTGSTIGTISSGVTGNIEVLQYGIGSVSFSAGTGTTLRYSSFVVPTISEQYATAAITKLVSAGEIRIFGELLSI